MIEIAFEEVEAHFSKFVRRAENGEQFAIVRAGGVAAILRSATADHGGPKGDDQSVRDLKRQPG